MPDQYYYGTGRRKTAVARVRLYQGPGNIVVNGKIADDYFGRLIYLSMLQEPFAAVEGLAPFNASVKVLGGGTTGQAGAIRHGIARALVKYDESLKPALRKAGLLTRDARVKERKKYGLKRARKAPQFTKR